MCFACVLHVLHMFCTLFLHMLFHVVVPHVVRSCFARALHVSHMFVPCGSYIVSTLFLYVSHMFSTCLITRVLHVLHMVRTLCCTCVCTFAWTVCYTYVSVYMRFTCVCMVRSLFIHLLFPAIPSQRALQY
jgi:hypothetical protein